jgi:CheY-like chemotaxis protein/two-component sensor histidine kinase
MQLWPFVENDKQELEKLRGMIERQLQMLVRLTDDLLDISRITRGKIELRKQPVDLSTIVASAVETVRPLIDAHGHQLTLTLPDRPVYVEGDVARLSQVFGNIVGNAAKHVGRNGVVWVEVDEQGVVRVRDNGPGIPQHMLKEIFELFRQGDASLTRANGGLGIGLTLAKRLVEAHGGTIEARSEGPGKGAEFIVTLPTIHKALPSEASRFSIRRMDAQQQRRIGVVDDVDASAQTLGMMLRAVGHDVTTFNDGPSAIEWTLKNSPEVMFLDIAMPGMSGYDVARELRAKRPALVLVALTGYGQDEDRRKAFEAGFNHHMVKPATLEALEDVLATAVPEPLN